MRNTDRAVVYAVGRRAFVHGSTGAGVVELLDDKGAPTTTRLRDGAEVEIVAWVPGGLGTRYHVRPTDGGEAGWLTVGSLRAAAASGGVAGPPTTWSTPPQPGAGTSGHAPRRSKGG